MRHRIASRVAELPLAGILADALVLPLHARQQIMVSRTELIGRAQGLSARCQQVTRMFHIRPHSQLFARTGIVQPVLPLYVIGLAFLGGERRGTERQLRAFAQSPRQGERAEKRAEEILLLAVEVNREILHVLHRTELRRTVLRLEAVAVARNISDDVQRPVPRGRPRQIRLIIQKRRVILSRRLQRAQQIAVRLVAQSL